MNSSQKENFTLPAICNNTSYTNQNLYTSFVNEYENKICSELKMDANTNHDNDDLINVFSNCARDGDSSGFGVGITSDTIEEDISFQDDNVSHVDSDYSDFQPTDQDYTLVQQNIPDYYGEQCNELNIRYNPAEFMFRPPSGSAMHFNYHIPAASSLSHNADIQTNHYQNSNLPTNKYTQQQPCLNPSPSDMSSCSTSAAAPIVATQHSRNTHSHPGCVYPNMWYPNAPFGSYKSYGSHTYNRQSGPQLSQNQLLDLFQLSNSSRVARNQAEKNRRDKLNGSIQELSTMVPHVAESPKRVDKTAVLRFAAHGLRLKYVFGKSQNHEATQTTDALMKLLDSFFITLTCSGQIVLVSSSVEQHLGHCQTDLYGQNILHITHPDDHQLLKEKLIPNNLDKIFHIQPDSETGDRRPRTQEEEDEIDRRLQEDNRNFTIRLAIYGPKSEPIAYEIVRINGSFRRSDMAPRDLKMNTISPPLQIMRRSRGRENALPLPMISSNDIVLVAIARIVRPPSVCRPIEANCLEYKTRHLIDGRIVDCDQRISIVAGYMPNEVRNLSPFTFIHQNDVRWVIVALRQMYDCDSSYGESTYRLFTGNGKFIYLHTKGFLEIDKYANKVHSFTCINTLLDEEEGKLRVESMKKKFSVIINTKIPQSSDDLPASENPQQLENAVMCLIQNLKSISDDDGDLQPFSIKSHNQAESWQRYSGSPPQMGHLSKTPPLALVPPTTDSIKSSITKAINVVKTTAVKYLRQAATSTQQPTSNIDGYLKTQDQALSEYYTASAPLKRNTTCANTDDDDDYIVPKQRRAMENALSNSLQQINNRLNQQLNTAMEIRDQGKRYEIPYTEERIADLMEEHLKQQELYTDITNEFKIQRKYNEDSISDNETLPKCSKTVLEEQKHRQQQNLVTTATNTAIGPQIPHEAHLKPENQIN